MTVECQRGRKNRVHDEAKPGTGYRCGNPSCRRELHIVIPSASNSRTRKLGDGARFFHAVVITFLVASAFIFYTPILSARKRNSQAGIYTLRDPETGAEYQFHLDHRPDVLESMQLINEAESRALGAQIKMDEAKLAIERQYKEPGFDERTFLFAKGELESIPEAIAGLAIAIVHPIDFAHKIAAHPWSTVPFISDAISLRNLYSTGTLSPTWFKEAGKDIGLGALLAFLLFSYGVAAVFLKCAPDSALAGRIRWFFATPIFLNRVNLNALRNWAQEVCAFCSESEGTDGPRSVGYANLNRRHKAMLFLTLIVTGLALLDGIAIGKGLGVALLGVAAAWVIGSNSLTMTWDKYRKTSGRIATGSLNILSQLLYVSLVITGLILIGFGMGKEIYVGVVLLLFTFFIYRKYGNPRNWRHPPKR